MPFSPSLYQVAASISMFTFIYSLYFYVPKKKQLLEQKILAAIMILMRQLFCKACFDLGVCEKYTGNKFKYLTQHGHRWLTLTLFGKE